jgi:hypothetical protein
MSGWWRGELSARNWCSSAFRSSHAYISLSVTMATIDSRKSSYGAVDSTSTASATVQPPCSLLRHLLLGLLVERVVGAEGGERRGAPRRGRGGGLREGRVGRRGRPRRGGACGGDLGGLAAEAARAGLERGDEGAEQPRRAAAAPDVHHRRLRQLEPSRQPGHDCSVAVSPSFACKELVVAHRSLASWSLEVEN